MWFIEKFTLVPANEQIWMVTNFSSEELQFSTLINWKSTARVVNIEHQKNTTNFIAALNCYAMNQQEDIFHTI